MSDRRVIRCQECDRPIAELRDGLLIVKSRHYNMQTNRADWHVTAITFERLRELIATAEADAKHAA